MTTETPKTPHDEVADDEIMISINLFFSTKPEDDENSTITFSDASISGLHITPEGAESILKSLGFANLQGTTLEKIVAIACEAIEYEDKVVDLG